MHPDFFQFIQQKMPELLIKLAEQFDLVLWAVLIALLIGIPLGILVYRYQRIKTFTIGFVSALWTIPSLALLAFFIPFFGIGLKPAIIVLSIYAILPILRNTVTGLEGVPEASIEAATGLGFTRLQRLWLVELPLAMPVIVAGIRTAVSISVGVATLAAFIGAGGLGDFINQGLALNNSQLILLGAIPAAMMALLLDFLIGRLEKFIRRKRINKQVRRRRQHIVYAMVVMLVTLIGGRWVYSHYYTNRNNEVIIATKNFGESFILGHLMADMIRAKTHLEVIEKFNLGATSICQAALLRGDIDMYPEYTGTASIIILKQKNTGSAQQVFNDVKKQYEQRFHLTWLPPFGFNNTQALAITNGFATKHHLRTISELVPLEHKLVIAAPAGFLGRPDGYIGLKKVYGLNFKAVKQMDPGLMYKAIKRGDVNIINAFSTDGRILSYHLDILKDDKNLYPPYDAAIVIRENILKQHPEIYHALKPLFGLINNKTMQQLNYEVDMEHKSPANVARNFLVAKHLLNQG